MDSKAVRFDSHRIERYFDRQCSTYGNQVDALGWFTRQSQTKRFEVLSGIADLNGERVLDVGCGLGDFYGYLISHHIHPVYHGIDVSSRMIDQASENFPGVMFQKGDIFDPSFSETYDYLVCSGTFNIRISDSSDYISTAIRQLYHQSRKGIAFNLLSAYSPEKYKDNRAFHYFYPEKILEFCLSVSPFVTIRTDYLPNDFTVYLFREEAEKSMPLSGPG